MHKFTDIQYAMQVVKAKATLIQMAQDAGATIHFSDHPSCLNCVNVHTADGSFILTAYYNTLLNNIYTCTNWLAEYIYRDESDGVDRIEDAIDEYYEGCSWATDEWMNAA